MRARNARGGADGFRARARGGGRRIALTWRVLETTGGGRRSAGCRRATAVMGGESGDGGFARAADADGESASEKGEKRAVWPRGCSRRRIATRPTTGSSTSSLLPVMSMDLKLDDGEGAVLTTLFTVTYSLLLRYGESKNLLAGVGGDADGGVLRPTAHSENFGSLVLSRGLLSGIHRKIRWPSV